MNAQCLERFICGVSDLRFTGVHWAFRENRVFYITPCNAILYIHHHFRLLLMFCRALMTVLVCFFLPWRENRIDIVFLWTK